MSEEEWVKEYRGAAQSYKSNRGLANDNYKKEKVSYLCRYRLEFLAAQVKSKARVLRRFTRNLDRRIRRGGG